MQLISGQPVTNNTIIEEVEITRYFETTINESSDHFLEIRYGIERARTALLQKGACKEGTRHKDLMA